MTDQERYQAFVAEYENLINRYGFQIGAEARSEMLGPVVQIRPVVVVAPVAGWTAKPDANGGEKSAQTDKDANPGG